MMDHYGLIGNPVSQSLSEKYFTDKFMLEDIDARFERFLLKDIHGLPKLLDAYPGLKGLSVTSPYKTDVIQYCTELDEIASKVSAVNTLKILREGNKLTIKGYNTDVDGFSAVLLPLLGKKKPDALILGSGGAARAVVFALSRLGIRYRVVSRTPGKGKISYQEITEEIVRTHTLIINATSLGMEPYRDLHPDIPYQHLTSRHLLYDLIYNPSLTSFLQKGKTHKTKTENGFGMLQAQAELAWGIWREESSSK
jgi:shikimate dehydrogenase